MKRYIYTTALIITAAMMLVACDKNDIPLIGPNEYEEQPIPKFDVEAGEDGSLPGAIIGTKYSVDYGNGAQSTTVNTKANVFDRNFSTFFASYERSMTWVGLDLGEKHVITKIGYAPRNSHGNRVELAVIQGANRHDFLDAVPLYLISEEAPQGKMTYVDVKCSRGFRYVRYVSPNDVCGCGRLCYRKEWHQLYGADLLFRNHGAEARWCYLR